MERVDGRLDSARSVLGGLDGLGRFGRIQAQAQGQTHMVVVAGGQP